MSSKVRVLVRRGLTLLPLYLPHPSLRRFSMHACRGIYLILTFSSQWQSKDGKKSFVAFAGLNCDLSGCSNGTDVSLLPPSLPTVRAR